MVSLPSASPVRLGENLVTIVQPCPASREVPQSLSTAKSPEAEIFLMGVEEPTCLIHAPNESVDPSEIENLALAEALFLEKYANTCHET